MASAQSRATPCMGFTTYVQLNAAALHATCWCMAPSRKQPTMHLVSTGSDVSLTCGPSTCVADIVRAGYTLNRLKTKRPALCLH